MITGSGSSSRTGYRYLLVAGFGRVFVFFLKLPCVFIRKQEGRTEGLNPFGDSISVINKSSGYENFDRGARPSVSWGLGRNYAEHGPGFPTSGRRGEDQDFHAPVSPYFLSRQESDGADTSAARSVHRAVREYDESVQLDRRGAVDRPREAGFRADEILDPLYGALFRYDRPLCQKERYDAYPLSDRQRRTA